MTQGSVRETFSDRWHQHQVQTGEERGQQLRGGKSAPLTATLCGFPVHCPQRQPRVTAKARLEIVSNVRSNNLSNCVLK